VNSPGEQFDICLAGKAAPVQITIGKTSPNRILAVLVTQKRMRTAASIGFGSGVLLHRLGLAIHNRSSLNKKVFERNTYKNLKRMLCK
jgi:hypothetical protein